MGGGEMGSKERVSGIGSGRERLVDGMGRWNVSKEAWGVLELVWPKPGKISYSLVISLLSLCLFSYQPSPITNPQSPRSHPTDILIIGTGPSIRPLSPETRQHINSLGIRVDVLDTRNAAAQFNLLATERGLRQVAAALVPLG